MAGVVGRGGRLMAAGVTCWVGRAKGFLACGFRGDGRGSRSTGAVDRGRRGLRGVGLSPMRWLRGGCLFGRGVFAIQWTACSAAGFSAWVGAAMPIWAVAFGESGRVGPLGAPSQCPPIALCRRDDLRVRWLPRFWKVPSTCLRFNWTGTSTSR